LQFVNYFQTNNRVEQQAVPPNNTVQRNDVIVLTSASWSEQRGH